MIDLKDLRDNPEKYKTAATQKRIAVDIDRLLELESQRRGFEAKRQQLTAEKNSIGKQIGQLAGKLKSAPADQKAALQEEMKNLQARPTELKALEEAMAVRVSELDPQIDELLLRVPAIPDPSWPIGKDDADNVVDRLWADPNRPPQPLQQGQLDHISLGQKLGILDFDRGVKLAGSRSYVVRGAGAMLYNAVLRYAMDTVTGRGYESFVVPVLVTEQCMIGTGYFPAGRDQAYVTQDNSVLVGTSEVPLASFYGGEVLDEAQLPLRMVALSTCFRREAGAAGKDTAGLYRVHQFDKVEQVVVHKADDAEHIAIHEEIIANAEAILQGLKLAYRVVKNCTGDMGQGKWRMYDIETWMPSRNGYGETHSGSALRDFQSRRLNLRYRKVADKQTQYCYTLNNTAIACPRVLVALLETYQQPDGSVTVPEVLRPYMGGRDRIGASS